MKSTQSFSVEEAKKKLEYYCAYQERCHQEVKQKLKNMNMIPEASDVIIVHLLEHKFLNETRFAKSFASGKFRIKKWGKRRIALELKRKEITKYNIDQALNDIDEEEYLEVFNALAEKKEASLKETDNYKKKKKLIDYLLYRGWENYLVYDKANELIF
ncbi:RecX family transcriptional regulator [Olleya sp. YSTF-M6]|uniref:Regulatory protein RecX n=1 Tax=Olleya sediminilitoris TaxID=2795739 RepID=A0ABS1WGN7_9FLAO|nr:regulatory protein RecX [Olleya sediminilitoris]MBL7558275.1 RecX family transcriptional regulator [Olleya sediminilitoris]